MSQQAKAQLAVMEAQLALSAIVLMHGQSLDQDLANEALKSILAEATPLALQIAVPRTKIKELRVKEISGGETYLLFLKTHGKQAFAEFIEKALAVSIRQSLHFLDTVLELNTAIIDEEVVLHIADSLNSQFEACLDRSQKSLTIWVHRRLLSL